MIHLIICGHGNFATGVYSGAKLLCGVSEACDAVDFSEGMSAEALKDQLQQCVDTAGDVPILFLTDILGGTPFRECAAIVSHLKNAEVITGANLQMLVEAAMEREDAGNVQGFARDLVESAKDCMTLLSEKLAAQRAYEEQSADDGI